MLQQVSNRFSQLFGQEPLIVTSPGRINLIGEHTDYNNGFVLPATIDKVIVYAIALNGTDQCNVHAMFNNETASFSLDNIQPVRGWVDYLQGVVYQLQQRGLPVRGFNCVLHGDIPIGAGLSSSAAVEGGLAVALDHLLQLNLDRMEMARIGQLAEHTFPGVKCGIMDQFANLHGKKGEVMLLDCRSLEYAYFPFQFPDYKVVLCNSMVHHSLASSAYNERRQQCETGVAFIREKYTGVESLRDADMSMLNEVQAALPPKVYDRCAYVIAENTRVQEGARLLQEGNLSAFGKLMYATHDGLSRLYEVSCPELDFLVSLAQQRPEVAGARVMGGGFGGCTINLVKTDMVEDYINFIREQYETRFGKIPEVYVTTIEDGAKVCGVKEGELR